MFHKYSPNTERAAECQRLIEEIRGSCETLRPNEEEFIADMEMRLLQYKENTRITDKQYDWIVAINERVT